MWHNFYVNYKIKVVKVFESADPKFTPKGTYKAEGTNIIKQKGKGT